MEDVPLKPLPPRGLDHWGVLESNGWEVSNTGCWEYAGPRFVKGYGQVKAQRSNPKLAHRVSYEHFNGPIPDGLVVRHKCDNPPCVNPDHLETGTQADNVADSIERNRRVSWMGPAKMTADQVRELRRELDKAGDRLERGRGYATFAEKFGVSRSAIQKAYHRITYYQIDD